MTLPVFTDASSAILLEKAGLFAAFSKAFRIVFSDSVFNEITRSGYPGAAFFLTAFQNRMFEVSLFTETSLVKDCPPKKEMDQGERDTLCLFLKNKQGFILTDDGRAAAWCRDHDLPLINSLLVPKIFWYAGLMNEEDYLNKMEFLCHTGRYSQKIKDLAFSFEKKELTFFIPEKKMNLSCFDTAVWRKKAVAFVTRCHQHLFGK
jgi:predicted nucleic acid-binding protein